MIGFQSNNAALEPITAFAHSSESVGGDFLQTRWASQMQEQKCQREF
jgi:hypothetical protein